MALAKEAAMNQECGTGFDVNPKPIRVLLVEDSPIDVVLLDLFLEECTGLETLFRVREAAPAVPVVIVTGQSANYSNKGCLLQKQKLEAVAMRSRSFLG